MGVFFGKVWRRFIKGASSLKDPSEVYASFTKTRERPHGAGTPAEGQAGARAQSAAPAKNREKSAAAADSVYGAGSGSTETAAAGAGEKPAAGGGKARPSAEQKAAMRKALDDLKSRYIGKSGNIDEELKNLIEEWNPLVAEQSKKNLIEDVNSAIRDFLRKLKRSLYTKPPDLERLQKLSAQIAEYEGFERIRKKDAFRRYIELYMIKVLRKNL
jgi:hypothetical protein